jgi:hypothetical protein
MGTALRSISHERNHQSNRTVILSDKYLWPVPELTPVHEAYKLASFQEPVTISLSHELILKVPRDPRVAKLLNSIQSRLSALVLSATVPDEGSHLPEKEIIRPNQWSWPETAAWIGVKRGNKKNKVDSVLMAQHIGEPNRKRTANNDPYGAGEQSGKQAKPNVRSAATNARACTAAEWAKAEPPPTQIPPPTLPPPASLPFPTSLPPRVSFPPYHFYPSPVPLSQPTYPHPQYYSHFQGAPSAPPYYSALPFSTYSHHM